MRDFEALLLISTNNRIKVEFYQKKNIRYATALQCVAFGDIREMDVFKYFNFYKGLTTQNGRDRKTIVGCFLRCCRSRHEHLSVLSEGIKRGGGEAIAVHKYKCKKTSE